MTTRPKFAKKASSHALLYHLDGDTAADHDAIAKLRQHQSMLQGSPPRNAERSPPPSPSRDAFRTHYGFHRVVAPPRSSVQAAYRVNAASVLLHPTEVLVAVDRLILDSTSARSLREKHGEDGAALRAAVAAIIKDRGKMHNPVTQSGGVLLGTVEEVGAESPLGLKKGDRIVPLASLTCIPLRLRGPVKAIQGECVVVDATAVLFASSPVARCPPDIDPAVCVLGLDISSLVPQVERAVLRAMAKKAHAHARSVAAAVKEEQQQQGSPGRAAAPEADWWHVLGFAPHPARAKEDALLRAPLAPLTVYIQGCGKSGLAACSAIRRLQMLGRLPPEGVRIFASDVVRAAAEGTVSHYADATAALDSRDSLATLGFLAQHGCGGGVDLVLACHNQPDCETSAVLSTAEGGTAIFFSMATVFSQANLATDIAGKAVNCSFGVGLAEAQDAAMFALLREDKVLRDHFEGLSKELAEALAFGGDEA